MLSLPRKELSDRHNYTRLNISRMRRLDKTIKINEVDIDNFQECVERQTWIVLAESWCGDTAQSIPVKIAEVVS